MTTPTACYHCALPVLDNRFQTTLDDGTEAQFCCGGCQAAAQAILYCGLSDYYQWRSAGQPVVPLTAHEARLIEQLDHPDVQARFVTNAAGHQSATLQVEGIHCAACIWMIEQHLQQQEGVIAAHLNQSNQRLWLEWQPDVSLTQLAQGVAQLGYRLRPYRPDAAQQAHERTQKQYILRLIAAGVGSMQVMMNAVALYTGNIDATSEHIIRWASMLLTLPVIIYAAWPFYHNAWQDVRHGRLGMDVPVAIAIILTFFASALATLTRSGEVYFESLCMFTFFLLLGRFLEFRSRRALVDSGNALDDLIPAFVQRECADQRTETVAVSAVAVGDVLHLLPGERVPLDGVLHSAVAELDESSTTGEYLPRQVQEGDVVRAGSINLGQPMSLRVTRLAGDSSLSTLQRLLARAQREKPNLIAVTDRLAQQFVAVILVLAAVSYTAWLFIDADRAFWIAISVLVVTCPCALSLAAPTVLTVANDRLRRAGFLVTRGHVLDILGKATQVWLDKTGTLTEGQYQRGQLYRHAGAPPDAECLRLAAALELNSEHPIAAAFSDHTPTWYDWDHWEWLPGVGVAGQKNGRTYRLTTRPESDPNPTDNTQWVRLSVDAEPWLDIELVDALRDDAPHALEQLHTLHLHTGIVSGDPSTHVDWIAKKVQVEDIVKAATPDTKLALLQSLQQSGECVVMVGDGLNDAAALKGADVSIAMANGTDWSKHQADALILNGRLTTLPLAVRVARRSAQLTRQNVQWATVYNVLAIPLAGVGLVTPWMAAIGMSASSLIVVFNALRVRNVS
ncbi:heavy metal translocating P-type ATPase [Salinispirillum sp. LH 10-3-1]|uniref:Heavy metal translocating P-type ATPase n=1 Tax=Salinispirillum sp. LH 10-3-1 TaxID=2952525 RepID=A0AB38YD83_9GAMM